jgi:tetratricopeptide (TPR) repeat protein
MCNLANNRASELLALGLLDEGEREIELSDRLNREIGRELGLAINELNRGELHRRRGRIDLAAEVFEATGARFNNMGRSALAAYAWLNAATQLNDVGRHGPALELIVRADAVRRSTELDVDVRMMISAEHARALALCGRTGEAEEIVREIERDPALKDLPQAAEIVARARPV